MILLLSAFVFKGGDAGDLARTVAAWSGRPVVALVQGERARSRGTQLLTPDAEGYVTVGNGARVKVDPIGPEWRRSRPIPPFGIALGEVGNGKDLTRLLRVKGKLESDARGGGIALWEAAWQPATTFVEGDGVPLSDGWKRANPETVRVEQGRVDAALPHDKALQVDDLVRLKWSKPLSVHWLIRSMWVVPCAKGASERTMLQTLAVATSGRLLESKDAWRIELDAKLFRPRAQASIRLRVPTDERNALAVASYDLATCAWDWIDDETIDELFRAPHQGLARPVKAGTPLSVAMGRYLAAFSAWTVDPPINMRNAIAPYRSMLRRIDPDGEPKIVITQNLGASGGWPRIGGGTVMP